MSSYVAQLQKLSKFCGFKHSLEDMLRDCLVCGCKDKWLQCKLLAEKDLTFQQAITIAKATEAAEKETKDLQQPATAPVNASIRERNLHQNQSMSYLGWHATDVGASIKPQTVNIKMQNASSARKKATFPELAETSKGFQNLGLSTKAHQLLTGTVDGTELDEYSLYHTKGLGTTLPVLVTLQLNGQDLTMELDTGATLSIVSEKTYQSLFSPHAAPQLKPSTAQLKTYMEEVLQILGEITVTVCYKDKKSDLSVHMVAGNGPSLLGRDWLSQIKLDCKQLYQLNHVKATPACQ